MIRAVIVDLDDTLLRRDKTVSAFTIETLRQCRGKGIKLMVATARGRSAKKLVPFDLFDGFVQMNGATGFAGDYIVYEKLIPPDVYIPFLQEMDKAGIHTAAEIEGVHYANFPVPHRQHEVVDFNTLTEAAEKAYVIIDAAEKADTVRRALPEGLWAHFTNDGYALLSSTEATKKNAVAAVLAHWGIPAEEAAAFGDDTNDVEMLAYCGTGVAMGNALDEVKAIANNVCMDCDDDGVAKWLASHVL